MRASIITTASLVSVALAHGDHTRSQKPMVAPDANWMTVHMAEEHHISSFDPEAFFMLHDFDSNGRWEPHEILRFYGLEDESNRDIRPSRRDEIQAHLMSMLDLNRDGSVSRDEFVQFTKSGKTLPDMATGPGHHGDDEYEYEIHHWEKYHNDDTTIEELTHPEDIAHFKKHEEMEAAEERLERLNKMAIVEENIPSKFRRGG
ncbi:hypothetical protein Micbo1qcDRAFT_129474 [Microdochium bolleyi]|uniref:EF-hand domain-containing protein n=1 Tax=Microdochium bolleyi TaxID=196109 RepID=A0A136JGW2_9PEZI|nr:hypothetical protein Micbo1qcDRAFT_129474 [Microdochium bolleyi]